MPIISFPIDKLDALVDCAQKQTRHIPSPTQCYYAPLFREGVPQDMTDDQIFDSGRSHIDYSKVPPGFLLVKDDKGVYLLSNGENSQVDPCYAEGLNRFLDDNVTALADEAMGTGPDIEYVPMDWYENAKAAGNSHLVIQVYNNGVDLTEMTCLNAS